MQGPDLLAQLTALEETVERLEHDLNCLTDARGYPGSFVRLLPAHGGPAVYREITCIVGVDEVSRERQEAYLKETKRHLVAIVYCEGLPPLLVRRIPQMLLDLTGMQERYCRVCGCTETEPCEYGCSWVEVGGDEGDLCSACVEEGAVEEAAVRRQEILEAREADGQ